MGHRADSNAWQAFMLRVAPLLRIGDDVFEIGPGNHRRSLVGTFCRDRGILYCWGDLNNRGCGESGFRRVDPDGTVCSPPDAFAVVVSFQMLHNCNRPWRLIPEMTRICRPGGIVAVVTSMWEQENRHPVDCGRIWPDGLRVLFDDAGLVTESMEVLSLDEREKSVRGKNTIGGADPADLVGIGRKPG